MNSRKLSEPGTSCLSLSGSLSVVVPRPEVSASPGNLLEIPSTAPSQTHRTRNWAQRLTICALESSLSNCMVFRGEEACSHYPTGEEIKTRAENFCSGSWVHRELVFEPALFHSKATFILILVSNISLCIACVNPENTSFPLKGPTTCFNDAMICFRADFSKHMTVAVAQKNDATLIFTFSLALILCSLSLPSIFPHKASLSPQGQQRTYHPKAITEMCYLPSWDPTWPHKTHLLDTSLFWKGNATTKTQGYYQVRHFTVGLSMCGLLAILVNTTKLYLNSKFACFWVI